MKGTILRPALLLVLFASTAIALQAAHERLEPAPMSANEDLLYIRSGEFLKRSALGFDALVADVYWLRTL